MRVSILVGSLRPGSINREIALIMVAMSDSEVQFQILDNIDELPFYREDLDSNNCPQSVASLRNKIFASDALLVVMGEHNHGIPAVLKNAIDWASRPHFQSSLSARPVGIIGATFGHAGGTYGQAAAKETFRCAGSEVLESIQLSIGNTHVLFASTHPSQDRTTMSALRRVKQQLTDAIAQSNRDGIGQNNDG